MITKRHYRFSVDITGSQEQVDLVISALNTLRPSTSSGKQKKFNCPKCNSQVVNEVCRVDKIVSPVIDIREYRPGAYELTYGASNLFNNLNLEIEKYVCANCRAEFDEITQECVSDV